MATGKTTRMDAQGRVILPPHIRKELGLEPSNEVSVTLEGETIMIRMAAETCVLCGTKLGEGYAPIAVTVGGKTRKMCLSCCTAAGVAARVAEEERA